MIARVHGIATAAGCQLVAQCDLAVASSEARFAVSGVNLGLFARPRVCRCRETCRASKRSRWSVTGTPSTRKPRGAGLVNRVVEPEGLDREVERLTASILAKPRIAMRWARTLFYRQVEIGLEDAYAAAGETMARNMMEAPALEGVQAFIDKRAPRW